MTQQQHSRTASPAPAARRRRQGGFLLPMMAGLLVVAGSTAAVVAMKEQRETFWEPRTETTSDLSEVNAAIIAYQRSKNHRLPCPSSLNLPSSNLDYGRATDCAASPPAGTFDVGTGSTVRIGALPTRTLGLPDSAGEDKWGNKLTYAVVKTHTDAFQFSNSVAGAGINVTTTTSGSTISNQAYIVVSHGKDGKGATPAKATSVGIACISTSGQDQENCDNDDQSFRALGMNTDPGANYFDDIVIFGTPDPVAQQTNRPCLSGQNASWSVGANNCSGQLAANLLDDGLNTATSTITNTNASFSGSATFRCTDGTLIQQPGATCNIVSPPVNGVCNNSMAWGCSAGTAINGVNAGCGGTRTWQCQGTNGGSTASCSQPTGACPVNGVCNYSVVFGCSSGTSVSQYNPGCGANVTWQCQGANGGSTASCSQYAGDCASPGDGGGSIDGGNSGDGAGADGGGDGGDGGGG